MNVKKVIDDAAEDLEKLTPKYGVGISYLVADRLRRLSQELERTGHLTGRVEVRYDYIGRPTGENGE